MRTVMTVMMMMIHFNAPYWLRSIRSHEKMALTNKHTQTHLQTDRHPSRVSRPCQLSAIWKVSVEAVGQKSFNGRRHDKARTKNGCSHRKTQRCKDRDHRTPPRTRTPSSSSRWHQPAGETESVLCGEGATAPRQQLEAAAVNFVVFGGGLCVETLQLLRMVVVAVERCHPEWQVNEHPSGDCYFTCKAFTENNNLRSNATSWSNATRSSRSRSLFGWEEIRLNSSTLGSFETMQKRRQTFAAALNQRVLCLRPQSV